MGGRVNSWVVAFVVVWGIFALPVVQAGDVPWLEQVITPPKEIPEPTRTLAPLANGEGSDVPLDATDWEAQRDEIRGRWLEFLGPFPERPKNSDFEVISKETLGTVERIRIQYVVEPGRTVEAFLIKPIDETPQKRPAVVVFHPTNVETMHVVAGTGGRPEQHIGLRLAERGFVTINPANFLWEEPDYDASVAAAKERNPKSLGMMTMLNDGMRAVDILEGLPEVDSQRIGTMGHSLGAKEAFYLMAFDDRVQAGVSSEGGIALDSTNWDDIWYLGPKIKEPDFTLHHGELAALIAPRPFLVFAGETGKGAADGDRSWPAIRFGQSVFSIYDQPVRMGVWNHGLGHKFPVEMTEKGFEWLEAYLAEPSPSDAERTTD